MNNYVTQLLTRQEAEKALEVQFVGKNVQLDYPGKPRVCGRCERIALEVIPEPLVHVFIDDTIYQISPEDLHDCLTLLSKV